MGGIGPEVAGRVRDALVECISVFSLCGESQVVEPLGHRTSLDKHEKFMEILWRTLQKGVKQPDESAHLKPMF